MPPDNILNQTDLSDEAVNTIVKRKRGNPALYPEENDLIKPGDNAKYIEFALQSWNMPKVDFSDTQAVTDRINWYFNNCRTNDMKPGVVGLSNALGVSRKTLWSWKNEVRGSKCPESVDLIKRAYSFLEELWEDYMQNGKISPPNGIFLGKNHFDYKDVSDVVVTPNTPLDGMTPEQVSDRYLQGLPEISGEKPE